MVLSVIQPESAALGTPQQAGTPTHFTRISVANILRSVKIMYETGVKTTY
jgi:hypothetical protein